MLAYNLLFSCWILMLFWTPVYGDQENRDGKVPVNAIQPTITRDLSDLGHGPYLLVAPPDEKAIIVSMLNRTFLWNLERDDIKHVFRGIDRSPASLAFVPGTHHVALPLRDGSVDFRDLRTSKLVTNIRVHDDDFTDVSSIAISPCGALLAATTSSPREVTLAAVDIEEGRKRWKKWRDVPAWLEYFVEFSSDGNQVIVGGRGLTGYDAKTGEQIFESAIDRAFGIPQLSPDGRVIAVFSIDWEALTTKDQLMAANTVTVRLFNLVTQRWIWEFPVTLGGHNALRFAADGNVLLSGEMDGSLRITDVVTRRTALIKNLHEGRVVALTVMPNRGLLVSGSEDGNIHVWQLDDILSHVSHPRE